MTVDTATSQRLPLQSTGIDAAGDARSNDFSLAMLAAVVLRALVVLLGVLSVYSNPAAVDLENATGYPWVAWDGNHYLTLAQHGYAPTYPHDRFTLIAYFPALPLAARALSVLMHPAAALVVVANLCSFVGFAFLYSLARQLSGPRVAVLCVLLVATFPGAVFFSAGLTEGPFFMLSAITLWLLHRQKYWTAALVAAVATATRPTGIALAMLVPLHWFVQHPRLPFTRRAAIFVVLGLVSSLGGMLYQGFIWNRYKMFDAYFVAQKEWEIGDQQMVQQIEAEGMERYSLRFFMDRAGRPQAWNRIIALALIVITVVGFFRPGPIPRLFFLVPLVIFLMTYLPNYGLRSSSIFRYETAGIPIFLLASVWLSQMQRRGVLFVILAIGVLMQCYYAILYSRGSWVG